MNSNTLIGLVAAACTTLSFFPQLIQTIRTRRTKDISLGMYTLITVGLLIWLIYGLTIRDLPIILANTISFIASGTILVYKIIYK
jgi:MtN3 and saliva related transmembrane protein